MFFTWKFSDAFFSQDSQRNKIDRQSSTLGDRSANSGQTQHYVHAHVLRFWWDMAQVSRYGFILSSKSVNRTPEVLCIQHYNNMWHKTHCKGPVIIYDWGGSGVKWVFTGNIFVAHSARGGNVSRPTRHRAIIFRRPLLHMKTMVFYNRKNVHMM